MHTSESVSAQNAPHSYTANIIRSAWAWKYLRRNPRYRAAYEHGDSAHAASWSLVRFEDPDFDARTADVFCQRNDCRHVLPLTASAAHRNVEGRRLSLKKLQCRVAVHREE